MAYLYILRESCFIGLQWKIWQHQQATYLREYVWLVSQVCEEINVMELSSDDQEMISWISSYLCFKFSSKLLQLSNLNHISLLWYGKLKILKNTTPPEWSAPSAAHIQSKARVSHVERYLSPAKPNHKRHISSINITTYPVLNQATYSTGVSASIFVVISNCWPLL